jgi:hypothetical protein
VALSPGQLDAALAAGVDPASDPALTLRADRLREPGTRKALANTLQNLLDAAEEPPSAWRRGDPRPPIRRGAVLAARSDLLALMARLRQPGPAPVRAVALAARLAWDSASPVYAAGSSGSVGDFARTILRLLPAGGGAFSAEPARTSG